MAWGIGWFTERPGLFVGTSTHTKILFCFFECTWTTIDGFHTGGLIHMLCEGAKQYGDLRLNYRQLATVIDSIHNFCYGSDAGGKRNKVRVNLVVVHLATNKDVLFTLQIDAQIEAQTD